MQAFRLFNPDSEPGKTTAIVCAYLADLHAQVEAGTVRLSHFENVQRSLLPAADPNRFKGYCDLFGNHEPAQLSQADLKAWLEANPQWKSDETKSRNLSAVLACFNWAADEGLIPLTPYHRSRRLKLKRVERRDATDEEYDRVYNDGTPILKRLVFFLDHCGARTCEARELRWDQVRLDESYALFAKDEHKTSNLEKDTEVRVLGLDAVLVAEMRKWKAESRSEYVFFNEDGKMWSKNVLCQHFQRWRDRNGLAEDLTLYCFRHRFGTGLGQLGLADREIADAMGHRDPRTTRRYVHTRNKIDHIVKLAAKAARLRNPEP